MAPPSNQFDRRECSRQFATWFTSLPELEFWEDRVPTVSDLQRIAQRMENEGRGIWPYLPSLRSSDPGTMETLALWTERTMEKLEIAPPAWSEEQSPLEKCLELIDLLSEVVLPVEPLDEWR